MPCCARLTPPAGARSTKARCTVRTHRRARIAAPGRLAAPRPSLLRSCLLLRLPCLPDWQGTGKAEERIERHTPIAGPQRSRRRPHSGRRPRACCGQARNAPSRKRVSAPSLPPDPPSPRISLHAAAAEVGCPRQRRSGQRRAAEAETESSKALPAALQQHGLRSDSCEKIREVCQSAVIPVRGEAERHDGWLPPSVSGGRRQPEAVCGGQAAHGATRLHSARQRDVVRVLSHDWQACRHLLERCVKNQPSLVEKGVVCPCTGVWGVVLS